jgi:hypothetical protein
MERIATASGLAPGETERCLLALRDGGLVSLDPGPFGGWALTEPGRAADDEHLKRELADPGVRDRVLESYRRFLDLNPGLLEVCSDWQMRNLGGTPSLNDHSDDDYDARVLSRLFRVDDTVHALLADLAIVLPRFSVYRERLTSALGEVMAGNHAYLADGLESYHTVWFQLHEDLLTTLGISREGERRAQEDTGS